MSDDIILGGPCRQCGVSHPGQTCEGHQAEVQRAANRLAKAIMSTATASPDFYTRNGHVIRPIPNATSRSELLDGRSREIILRNVYLQTRGMRQWRGRDLWTWIGAMTGHGSGYSDQICRELGWDPDMRIGPKVDLPR